MKILLAEDEKLLSSAIAKGLKKVGYAVDQTYDGEEALEYLEINKYDLLILDLNMPKVDGITVLKTLRGTDTELKVLILSARSEIEDKVMGLDCGANDYLSKPFDFEELTARIRNLLRWSFTYKESLLICGGLELDMLGKAVSVDSLPINLTNKEYSILEYLMFHIGKVISAEEIIEHVWDSEVDLFSNSFKYHMHSLKKKLSAGGGDCIKNIRRQGYVIREGNQDA
ncbi:response regulator transcription factor [Lacrimispora sp.]|jgi:DNA-binding response OmpR family regulator|uniref:response regulator transcription factor n=1 Tax=Lacrimispora sp. TaxID=2719234 RepID=UPI0028AFF39B|nr:response regulator transcription factor [Lacrimispora sp.]